MNAIAAKPVVGEEYRLMVEKDVMTYRGKEYPCVHLCYEHKETGERFTTMELDELNVNQVYNQYRAEHGIPFPDEIRAFRKHYGLSMTAMSQILGFGNNQYGLYESGEVPSLSNGKLLKTVMLSPEAFGRLAEDSGAGISDKIKDKIYAHIAGESVREKQLVWRKRLVFGNRQRDKYNGYARQSLVTLKNCILYFVNRMGATYKTQMNKLLFYIDFLSYREYGIGMTGLSYQAMQYGPVPCDWNRVYSAFDDIRLELVPLSDGNVGERLVADTLYDNDAFTEQQLQILDKVLAVFSNMSSNQISQCSHTEQAWMDNVETRSLIDYTYAFSLRML